MATTEVPSTHGTKRKRSIKPLQSFFTRRSSTKVVDGTTTASKQALMTKSSASALLTKVPDRPDRAGRRRPFSSWMKKLTHFKGSSHPDASASANKRNTYPLKQKKPVVAKNNPYPESGFPPNSSGANGNGHLSFSTNPTGDSASISSSQRRRSFQSLENHPPPTIGHKSMAPTISTEQDASHSDAAASHGASSGGTTSQTVGGGASTGRGVDSTFSSPAPSVRSLTTTLTTIQSAAPVAPNGLNAHSIHFAHQFPSSPATALPAHLAPQHAGSGGHPATYSTATANNLLTDNASILTLASSSKRNRRRSMDTDASVRALAPSSVFGGSRESLPLSVLSSTMDMNYPGGLHQSRPSMQIPNERASIYSATGIAPALPSERNSYYAGKQSILNDGGSVKSGLLGHGRHDSVSGSIGGIQVGAGTGSPLASPRDPSTGKLSRSNSTWDATGNEEKDVAVANVVDKGKA